MLCYLVRHGSDDDTVRGGWSNHSLTSLGVEQTIKLSQNILISNVNIDCIYSSDLQRAKETSMIIARYLNLPITYVPEFREINNGDLAGMKNDEACKKYPGLYWSSLEYTECYPNGESPEMFFFRVKKAWYTLKAKYLNQPAHNFLLVTHSGVIEIILCIENNIPFTNKTKHFPVENATLVPLEIIN